MAGQVRAEQPRRGSRIEVVGEIGKGHQTANRVVFGDVEILRLHQCPGDLVHRPVETGQVRGRAAQLRDAEQRPLQNVIADRIGHIAEVPGPAGVLPAAGNHRHCGARQDAAVLEPDRPSRQPSRLRVKAARRLSLSPQPRSEFPRSRENAGCTTGPVRSGRPPGFRRGWLPAVLSGWPP